MVKIHGIVYIIVGIVVAIISSTADKLIVLFYMGWIFVAIGVIKLVFNYLKKKTGLEDTKKIHATARQHHQSQHRHHSQNYKYCRNCSNIARLHDRFCSRCGARI